MKRIILFLVVMALGQTATAQTKNFIDQPYIETSATVDTLVVPDKIYLAILIAEADSKGKVSTETLERRMYNTLTGLGIDTKEKLKLSDVGSNFKKYFLKNKQVLKDKSYTLEVGDAVTAGKVIVGLEEAGISNVRLSRLEYSGADQLELLLKQKAILEARNEAQALAQTIGQQIGGAIHISADRSYTARSRYEDIAFSIADTNQLMERELIDIDFEEIKFMASVQVKFALE